MFIRLNALTKILATLTLLLPIILLNSSCSFTKDDPVDPNDKTLSVIFGYFDMDDAPSWGGIDWVSVKQYKPKQSYYSCGLEEGIFWHIGVTNGSLQVESFGRNTRWYSNAFYSYNFGGQGRNETSRIIKKPGVYFLGSYKYKPIDSGSFFAPDQFDMVKTKFPSEKQVLARLLQIMQEDGDLSIYKHQIRRMKQRLRKLGG